MITSNDIIIDRPANELYALMCDTERWPLVFPHYRSVRLRANVGKKRLLEFQALRDMLPVSWTAEQENLPQEPAIRLLHISGWMQGMSVVWRFQAHPTHTLVILDHEPLLDVETSGNAEGEPDTGDFFLHSLGMRSLAYLKQYAEQRAVPGAPEAARS